MANSKFTRFSQVTICMGDIQRIHSDLRKLLEGVGYVGGTPFPVAIGLTRELMLPLLELAPILVVANRRGQQEGCYQVIGGVRTYLLAQHLLQSDDEVMVMKVEGRNSLERMMERFVAESIVMPVMLENVGSKELVQRIKKLCDVDSKLFHDVGQQDVARLLGISTSKLAGIK